LRKARTTPEERLWRALHEAFPSARFRFQAPFGRAPLGPYFADFCSHGAKLIVEVDGDTHAKTIEYDAERTRFLESEGYRVIRFTNPDVMRNLEGVLTVIATYLPSPLVGEGGAKRRMRGSRKA